MLSRPARTLVGARLGMIIGMIGRVTRTRMPATISAMPPARSSPPHPRSSVSMWRRRVEPVRPFPTDVSDDEQAPLPTEDPEARGDRAVLERNDGHGWLDRSASHGDPWIVERMGLRALKRRRSNGR